ncbi:MAG: hypothetical protein R3F61_15395 [Myxococcota bacterium]
MLALLLAGCFARYEPLRDALQLETSRPAEAESRLEGLVRGGEPLLTTEWRTALSHMCELREQRLSAAHAADPEASFEMLDDRARELARCDTSGMPVAAELEQSALRAGHARFQAALDAGDAWSGLAAVHPIEHRLPDDPWIRGPLRDWRTEVADTFRDARTGMPLRDAYLDDRAAAVLGEPGGALATLAAARSTVALAPHVTMEGCSASPPVLSQAGALETRGTWRLTGCEVRTSTYEADVTVMVERTRRVEQSYTEYRSVQVSVPEYETRCYAINQTQQMCRSYLTRHRQQTTTVPTTATRWVDETYEVPEVRKETRYRSEVATDWRLELETPFGPQVVTGHTTAERVGATAPPTDAVRSLLWERASADAATKATEAVAAAALAAWRSAPVSDADGLEDRLAAHALGAPLEESDRAGLADALGLDPARVLPLDLSPRPYEPPGALSEILHRPRTGNLIRSVTFPEATVGLAVYADDSDAKYSHHPSPRTAGLSTRGQLHLSVSTGRGFNGLALHVSPFYQIEAGTTLRERYTYPHEDRRESRWAVRATGGSGAMAGLRADFGGVFVGVYPQMFLGAVGGTRRGYASVPWGARLEVRPRPRSPIVLEGWYGDLTRAGSTDLGAKLSLPTTPPEDDARTFLTLGFTRGVERLSLPGWTSEGPRVRGGEWTAQRAWIGYEIGI